MQYTQDYDERLPLVATDGPAYGWVGELQPYVKSTQLFQCPQQLNAEQRQLNPLESGYTDYWFNAHLSRRSLKGIDVAANVIAGGDGNDGTDGTDARYSLPALPPNWVNDQNSPLYRHLGAANYLFADGHVKAQKPAFLRNKSGASSLEAPLFHIENFSSRRRC